MVVLCVVFCWLLLTGFCVCFVVFMYVVHVLRGGLVDLCVLVVALHVIDCVFVFVFVFDSVFGMWVGVWVVCGWLCVSVFVRCAMWLWRCDVWCGVV